MNYELIYKVRKGNYKTDCLSNLEVGYCNKARAEAKATHEKYRAFLIRELKTEDFEVTNVACMADGVAGHVYIGGTSRGHGKRNCAFCGCDDFDC